MSKSIENLRDTIIPKSDQLNAEQLLGGDMTITVTSVKRGTDDQPISLHYEDDNGRPYKPCKTMRKVLIFAWGDDGREWVGKSITLYNNPDVKFGGVKVGGIRISHLSHIEHDLALSLTATKGKKENFVIRKLGEGQGQHTWIDQYLKAIKSADTMASLKDAYEIAVTANKKLGNKETHDRIVKAKDTRKAELTALPPEPAGETIDHETGEVL